MMPKSTADTLIGLIGLLTGFDPITDLILGAGMIAIDYIAAQGAGPYETALADPALLSSVQCAIYTAISADGYVTAANYPDVLTNLAAISYVDGDVVTTVHDYVAGLGLDRAPNDAGERVPLRRRLLRLRPGRLCRAVDGLRHGHRPHGGATSISGRETSRWAAGSIRPSRGAVTQRCGTLGLGPPYTDYLTIYLTTSVGLFVQAVSTGTGYALSNGGVSLNNANHHIVLKRVGSTAYLYVDGALVDSQPFGSGSINQVGGGSRFWNDGGYSYDGYMWLWAAYVGMALSDAEIAAWGRGRQGRGATARLHEFLADG